MDRHTVIPVVGQDIHVRVGEQEPHEELGVLRGLVAELLRVAEHTTRGGGAVVTVRNVQTIDRKEDRETGGCKRKEIKRCKRVG